MKQFFLLGFSAYAVLDNGTVKTLKNGKIIEPNAKGIVTLTATEDTESTVKGKKYPYNMSDLLNVGEGKWQDVPVDTAQPFSLGDAGGAEPAKEKTPAEIRRELIAKLKKEQKQLAQQTLDSKTPEETNASKALYEAKTAELEAAMKDGGEVELTEEQKAAIAEYNALAEEHAGALAYAAEIAAELKEKKETLPKGFKPAKVNTPASSGNVRSHADITDEIAQEIRSAYAVGRYGNEGTPAKVSEIAARFNIAAPSVMMKVNYLQNKLHRGDTIHTPLVNKYYPALGAEGNETGTDGAPYVEDGVIETNSRYVIPANRKTPAVTKKAQSEVAA